MSANLDGMADLEAKLVFSQSEKAELISQLAQIKRDKDVEINELTDKLNDLETKYKEARQAEVAVRMYEKKLQDIGNINTRVKELEDENDRLKDQNEVLLSERNNSEISQQRIHYYEKELLTVKAGLKLATLELDRKSNDFSRVAEELKERKELHEMRETQLVQKESELRDVKAKLHVYEKFESTFRDSSAQEDIQPHLKKTKNLQQRID